MQIEIHLRGNFGTTYEGVEKLMSFYVQASQYSDATIFINFSKLSWLDANLTAFLNALIFKLVRENNLAFETDYSFLKEKFHVLFRNGWLKDENEFSSDDRNSTVPFFEFRHTEEDKFIEYIEEKLMRHRSMYCIDKQTKRRIIADLTEVFQNIRHSRTNYPSFICGQYFPNNKELKLTLVDLGVGFLLPIKEFTSNQVDNDIDAIKWALSGKSSTVSNPATDIGGFGLEGIYRYSKQSNGEFQIYTGKGFWGTSLQDINGRTSDNHFIGSLINLIFNLNT